MPKNFGILFGKAERRHIREYGDCQNMMFLQFFAFAVDLQLTPHRQEREPRLCVPGIWAYVLGFFIKIKFLLILTKKIKRTTTGENRRFNQCILDLTYQCKSCLPLVAKSACLQTATAVKCLIDWTRHVSCSGSLKTGRFGNQRQAALALVGPI